MRIAYFVNQYPKVSHSFIRREILALEQQGFEVERFALRGWDADLVDEEDLRELALTRFILQRGVLPLVGAIVQAFVSGPMRFVRALRQLVRLSRRADQPFFKHLIYFAEACLLARWLRAGDAQHLHAHFGTNSAEVAALAHSLGGPSFSFTVHGPEEFDKPDRFKLKEKIDACAFVVAISSFGCSQLYRWIERAQWAKVHTVHCGLDKSFRTVTIPPIPAVPRLVCVGRICEQKGQLLLVQAAAAVIRNGIPLQLVLAGDGEMRRDVEKVIAELGIGAHVRITGWISGEQVQQELAQARALVLPSFAEGLPVVIMEALALARPVLSTYVAGIPELVRSGREGWLVPAGSLDELVVAMETCLTASPEALAAMGRQGRERVLERHCVDKETAKLATLIKASMQA